MSPRSACAESVLTIMTPRHTDDIVESPKLRKSGPATRCCSRSARLMQALERRCCKQAPHRGRSLQAGTRRHPSALFRPRLARCHCRGLVRLRTDPISRSCTPTKGTPKKLRDLTRQLPLRFAAVRDLAQPAGCPVGLGSGRARAPTSAAPQPAVGVLARPCSSAMMTPSSYRLSLG